MVKINPKKGKPMTKEELTSYFNDTFWPTYQSLCKTPFTTKWKAGTKGTALSKWLALKPSAALRERIISALQAQILHRKRVYQKCGSMEAYLKLTEFNKLHCNRMASTWLNQMGWEDEIPAEEEGSTELGGRSCVSEGCRNPTLGPTIAWCATHYPDTTGCKEPLMDWLKKNGLWKLKEEDSADWAARCRKHLALHPIAVNKLT